MTPRSYWARLRREWTVTARIWTALAVYHVCLHWTAPVPVRLLLALGLALLEAVLMGPFPFEDEDPKGRSEGQG